MKIKISRDRSYAQHQPALPQFHVKVGEYEIGPGKGQIPERLAKRIEELEGGKIVKDVAPVEGSQKTLIAAKKRLTTATNKLAAAKDGMKDLKDEAKIKAESEIVKLEEKVKDAQSELEKAQDAQVMEA